MKNYWQGGVCLAFADEVLCWLYGTVKESKILISISTSTIWAAQKAVTKAKYEWEQAFTLMKELKLKPPLLTFRAWIWATGTALDLKPNYVRAWANMGISYANQV
ncbi:protein SET DOMAIN GROUP 40-like [Gossypium arboreum]|nr:protein SET DOMAIN GROUP 40-like [Gossypium arboreum]XP_052874094.1 protein SET DOMAIN GROUP 40-like [Gossypium arboreum]